MSHDMLLFLFIANTVCILGCFIGAVYIHTTLSVLKETVAIVNGKVDVLLSSLRDYKTHILTRIATSTDRLETKLDHLNKVEELNDYDNRYKYLLQRYPDISPDVIRFIMDMGGKDEKTNA